MEINKEKEIVYQGLVGLTKESQSNRYFSKQKVMEYIKTDIEEKTGGTIHYRSAIMQDYSKVSLDELLPRQKTLGINLEKLAEEGRIHEIIPIMQGNSGFDSTDRLYRAKL